MLEEKISYYDNAVSAEIKSTLEDGEEILWQGKPKLSAFILSRVLDRLIFVIIWFVTISFIFGIVIHSYNVEGKEIPVASKIIMGVIFTFMQSPLLTWIFRVFTSLTAQRNTEYCITDRKIIKQSGVFNKRIAKIGFDEVLTTFTKKDLTDRLCNVGELFIKGLSDKIVIEDVGEVFAIEKKLNQLVEAYKRVHGEAYAFGFDVGSHRPEYKEIEEDATDGSDDNLTV